MDIDIILTIGQLSNILGVTVLTGSLVDQAERRAQALDPNDLIRVMPAEGSASKSF
jgi:hypothetical protein